MDTKLTLSFDKTVIEKAKVYAESQNISLSRLTEFLYRQITNQNYQSLENLPISDWVTILSDGEVEYITKSRVKKDLKTEYFESKKS